MGEFWQTDIYENTQTRKQAHVAGVTERTRSNVVSEDVREEVGYKDVLASLMHALQSTNLCNVCGICKNPRKSKKLFSRRKERTSYD